MTRAAIYARFSSDLQDARSIGDQVDHCRAYAVRQGWEIVQVYSDRALSGASVHGRHGFAQMAEDARLKAFDLVLVTDVDRLSRNIADLETFRAGMEFLGIAIHSCADGPVTKIHSGIKGLMGELLLDSLKAHTRRGMAGVAREGRINGGLTYGYEATDKVGVRRIVEHEARIVRRIFAEYAAGTSPRAIARRLNEEGIKPPRHAQWLASSINGNRVRGSGILMNALYDGRIIWNRVSMRKDPRTGRRVSRPNPESEWITTAAEELRIVPRELFEEVQAIKAARGKERPERSQRPRHLLAGLLRCGCCGSAMAVNNVSHAGRRIACGRRKEGGNCPNARTFPLAPIEARVIAALKAQLEDPRAIERYLKTYLEERRRLAARSANKRSTLERELATAEREIERVVDGIARGVLDDDEAKRRLEQPRRRRDAARGELATLKPPTKAIALHPAAIATYLAAIEQLAYTLQRRSVEASEEIAGPLRDLVASIVITPAGKMEPPRIEVTGRLADLIGGDLFPRTAVAGARYSRQRNLSAANDDLPSYRFAA